MSLLLALSTAEQGASLALFDNDSPVSTSFWSSRQTHSMRLMAMLEQVLHHQAGVALADIDGFIAARGPGSFTGLRIGISVIQGLAYAVSKPVAGISSLDGIAYRFASSQERVCVMMDAKRDEVYTAVYKFRRGELLEKSRECVCDPRQAVLEAGDNMLFAGSKAYEGLISELTHGRALISPVYMDGVSAAAMIRVARETPGLFGISANGLEPVYLRKSDAECQFGDGRCL